MTFIASKLFWAVMAPGNLLLLLLLAGVLWLAGSRRRRGLRLVGVVALLLLTIAVMPFGQWMAAPLEARHARPFAPATQSQCWESGALRARARRTRSCLMESPAAPASG